MPKDKQNSVVVYKKSKKYIKTNTMGNNGTSSMTHGFNRIPHCDFEIESTIKFISLLIYGEFSMDFYVSLLYCAISMFFFLHYILYYSFFH